MKVTLTEYPGCFGIDMHAECLQDATVLVRLGMNYTKELRACTVQACGDDDIWGYVVIGKRRQPIRLVSR